MTLSLAATRSGCFPDIAALIKEDPTSALFTSVETLLPFEVAMDWENKCLSKASLPFPNPTCFIWSMPQCLVVPKAISLKKEFKTASEEMTKSGWPVQVRQTGGDLTPQSPGVINISYIFSQPWTKTTSISEAYKNLCQPIIDYLNQQWGINSYCSAVEGAFCDGKYNVVVDGLKIAGTAQKWRQFKNKQNEPQVAVLGHVAILADIQLAELINASNDFYRFCNIDKKIELSNHTTLLDLCGRQKFDQQKIMTGLARSFELASSNLKQ